MNNKYCPTREQLTNFVLGKLPEAEIDAVADHTTTCVPCQEMLETLDGITDDLIVAARQGQPEDAASIRAELESLKAKLGPLDSPLTQDKASRSRVNQVPAQSFGAHRWLGQYQLLEQLGQGGMGTVYRALHSKLKRLVAVKLLPAQRLSHPRAVAMFHKEMEAVGKFDHPNIVRAHDAGELDGQHYLVMELVEGITLSRLVRTCGPLSLSDACEVIRQAAIGLQHAHEQELVHRDVKPSNLMLTSEGTVKILDLGLARLLADALENDPQSEPLILGSLEYMAPEQALTPHDVDHRADMYALGCTLYCLLAGKPPFSDMGNQSPAAKIRAHAEATSTPIQKVRADVPADVANLINRMMAKQRDERPANMSVIAELLSPYSSKSDLVGFLARHQALWRTASLPDQADGSRQVELSRSVKAEFAPSPTKHRTWRIAAWTVMVLAVVLFAAVRYYSPAESGSNKQSGTDIAAKQAALANLAESKSPASALTNPSDVPTIQNTLGMKFALIPAGKFSMGAVADDRDAYSAELPRHTRTIPQPFYLGVHEVTVGQFRQFVTATNYQTTAETDPKQKGGWAANGKTSKGEFVSSLRWNQPGFSQTENYPVCLVSWQDAVAFCEWLSKQEQAVYRLPTEDEWEYACRANTTGIRHCDSESLPNFDWFGVNSGHHAHPVGQKKPNPFGLHDMYGNVREWCADWYDETLYQRRVNDPAAIAMQVSSPNRSIRGGSFMDLRLFMRTSMRLFNNQHNRYTNIGFRVVREEGGAIKDM